MQKENKETLEEAIEKYVETYRCPATNDNEYCKHDIISAIKFGFKLAQGRMYSEAISFDEWIRINPHIWNYPDKLNDTSIPKEEAPN